MSLGCRRIGLAGAVALAVVLPAQALAWGSTGHRIIGRLAAEALPEQLPAFLRSSAAVDALGELSREPDRWKGAGKVHDLDLDPAHFVDADDDGKVLGGPALTDLPPSRAAYETALRAVGADGWKAGYLPYSIIESWQQLVLDLAYWRIEAAAVQRVVNPAHRAWLAADAQQREALTLRDLGVLSHYVGDGSQPLHVSEHFNGWGDFPNPEAFTQERVHVPFEGPFVRDFVRPEAVRTAMAPYRDCRCSIQRRTEEYLSATNGSVVRFYRLQKAGGFAPADPRGEAFAAERLAAGASELRDMVIDAWRDSAGAAVGWPGLTLSDVEAGKVDPYDAFFGAD
jgi:hypothetical protein